MIAGSATRRDLARTREWADEGTDVLCRALDSLSDTEFDRAALLPAWNRRQVLAHLARNAEALSRLLNWARTGTVTPMYADAQQRSTEIERSAQFDAQRLRRELVDTAATLQQDVAAMTEQQWSATVRSARGREIPAAEIPWMRAREVWLHALDLDIGVEVADLPVAFSRTLVGDVAEFLEATPDCPAVRLVDGVESWSIGDGGPLVRGEPAYLAAWLTGRSVGEGLTYDDLPVLPAWL